MERFGFEGLIAWQLGLEVVREVEAVADAIGRPRGDLADQLRRASLSVVANLAEGVGKDCNGRDQVRFFRIARGSACETAALVEAAFVLGAVGAERRAALRRTLLRLVGALTGLCGFHRASPWRQAQRRRRWARAAS